MSDTTAKAAYLKGLADGMKLDENKDCNKLLLSIIDLLGDVAGEISELDNEVGFLADCVEDIDGELDEIAEILSECGCDEGCGHNHGDRNETFEVACPTCKQSIILNMETFDDQATCPICGEEIEFEFDFDEDDFNGELRNDLNDDFEG